MSWEDFANGSSIVREHPSDYDALTVDTNSYRGLIIWQRAFNLAVDTCKFASEFPKFEQFGLASQLRRAAVSVPSNIAEGWGRNTPAERSRFVDIALGSACEVGTLLLVARELEYGLEAERNRLIRECDEVGRMLNAMRNRARKNSTKK